MTEVLHHGPDEDDSSSSTPSSRSMCCRLCLAPDSECISIFKSYAADKEPLVLKIESCVNIKITQGDRLSSQICHACISYLNSWQSFKNRCISSQNKQRVWLGLPKSTTITLAKPQSQNHHQNQQQQNHNSVTAFVTTTAHKQQNNQYQQNGSPKKSGYPMPIQIKEEPMDEDYGDENDIDPSLFLDNSHIDKKDEVDGSPPSILSSLGLQASGINPLSFLSTVMTDENHEHGEISITAIPSDMHNINQEASCRVCSQKFSTRANARRHERNQHPHLFETQPQIQFQKTVMKPVQQSNPIAVITTTTPFDYSKPDQYMHLLTDDKIQFIKENDSFLRQYQKMTCNCCNRTYTTYKNFMAHMRKKFQNLPRNLCFRCLKQNESKALFISHLKKRNCINLFKIFHGDITEDRIIKPISLAMQQQHQDLMANKLYECRHCSKSFKSKLDVRSHIYDEHSEHLKKDNMPGNCGFCGLEIEDPVEAKKHYNNMDCMVSIRCAICMDRFDNQNMFETHVFMKHATNSNNNNVQIKQYNRHSSEKRPESITPKPVFFSRLPQSCKICGQSYNNYNNVLRHMESKHPDQLPETYKCTECDAGYPRLSNLKDHMMDVHKMKCEKYRHSMDETSLDATILVKPGPFSGQGTPQQPQQQQPYSGRYDYVMKDLMSITNGAVKNERDDGDSGTGFSPEAKRIKLDTSNMKQCNICYAVFNNNIGLSNHMRSHTNPDDLSRSQSMLNSSGGGNSSLIDENANSNDGGNLVIDLKKDETEETDMDDSQSGTADTAEARFRRMRCRECQKRFSSKETYRRHMQEAHQIQNVTFIRCKLCNAEFAYEKGLRVHMFKIHNRILMEDMIIKSFECEICKKVYNSEAELVEHRSLSHLPPPPATNVVENNIPAPPTYWYQCRYCPANFNTNKKLAIHINSHDEFDSSDYSCKDCGNVYSGRKSLWVHRYKKHPPIPKPSGCESCGKIFFDGIMLDHHLPHCKHGGVPSSKHRTGDEDDVEALEEEVQEHVPQVKCTMCDEKFSDHEVFAKHIEMHQQDMFSDNPLAAMFGAGETKKNTKSYLLPINEFGEYSCDICHKTFPMLTSLKIHRNWHFRSDNRNDSSNTTIGVSSSTTTTPQQQTTPSAAPSPVSGTGSTPQIPQLVPSPHPRRGKTLKCQYCSSTFMSTNNLKRHIAEIHKNEINYKEPPEIKPEKYLYCRHCDKTFENRKKWVEHKIEDAKVMKPFSPFEWGCDICGKYWSRKERLVHHMMAHVRDSTPIKSEGDSEANNGFDSQDSDSHEEEEGVTEGVGDEMMEMKQDTELDIRDDEIQVEEEEEINAQEEEDIIEEVDEEEEEEEEEDDEEDDDGAQAQVVEAEVDVESQDSGSGSSSEEESDDDSSESAGKTLSCDLCQLTFNSQKDLQRHVASHFLNGPGAVTLNERQKTVSTSSSSTTSGGTSSSKDEEDNVEELIEEEVQDVSPVIEEDFEDEDLEDEEDDEEEDEEEENA